MTTNEQAKEQITLMKKESELKEKKFRFEVLMMSQEAVKRPAGTPGAYTVDPEEALKVASKYMEFISPAKAEMKILNPS